MATIEQEQQSRELLQQVLEGLSGFTASELGRTNLPEDLNLQPGILYFDRIIRLFKGLHDSDLADIPYNTLQDLISHAKAAFSLLQEIRDFSITKYPNNPINQRDAMIDRARNQFYETGSRLRLRDHLALYGVKNAVLAPGYRSPDQSKGEQ
jgi:hypothetical protein